jgi:flagellar biosynthesis protein FliR
MGIHVGLSDELSATLTGFLLVLMRVSAFVVIGPIFSARFIPQRIRAAVAIVIY